MYKIILILAVIVPAVYSSMLQASDTPYPESDAAPLARQCVILVHGMGRTKASMGKIEDVLLTKGYLVNNLDYPSTDFPIAILSDQYLDESVKSCLKRTSGAVHFVTHSLGGILVRYYLQDRALPQLGKIVMLSPPNHGSEVADYLKDWELYQWIMGPAGQSLGTGPDAVPRKLEPIPGTIGIITGNASLDPWFSWMITGENDGKVSVASAALEEMSDFMVVDASHAWIMRDDDVIAQIVYFLQHGKFQRTSPGKAEE